MRRMRAVGAAMVVCLVLGGLPTLAQEAAESPTPVAPAKEAVVRGLVDCFATYNCDFHRLSDPRVSGERATLVSMAT